ncbi:hypothetical protein [Corynebacterium aquilae]|uniref:Uncharacterized protein n=1 Tax=Corynebacterium aquilae DSM 44791 TaxID=1431546 RepID=A0A1L7CDM0_9CORY|nr:hypothetical protein [Corynebacterium aquilae]APT83941.1 hypothetical protein CAQU_01365 [Corynebacterium aquilae DSM 44791]
MSDKQLTVAELLARANKDGQGEAKPTRRRRRSLEEGGVSVAELTGSIPAVKSAPQEAKHGTSRDEASATAATAAKAKPATPASPAASAPKTPAPAQPTQQQPKAQAPAAQPARKPVAPPARPKQPAAQKPNTPLVKKAPVTPPPTAKPAPSAEETVVLNVVDADADRARLTTDTPKAGTTVNAPLSKPAQPAQPVKKVAPATPPAPAAAQPARKPVADSLATPKPATAPTPPAARTGELPVVKDVQDPKATKDEVLPGAPLADDVEEAEGGKVSILALLGMVIVGLLIGAGLFKGFEQLWLRLDSIIVAVLALAVTGGVVGIVHALRTERDGMSMFLAGLAGLAMTFGPVLITGF